MTIVADDAIVRDVGVGHHQHVIADDRAHPANLGAAMNRRELADGVVVANFESRRLAVKFQIRRRATNCGEREDSIALTDSRERFDDDVRAHHAAGPNLHARPDHRARTDFDARVEFGALVDDRGRMNSPRYRTCSLTSIADNSASAANSSPTRATACIRHSGR